MQLRTTSSIIIIKMKNILSLLLLLSATAFAGGLTPPESRALAFNQWYIEQLKENKSPLNDFNSLNQFVTRDTIAALIELYKDDSNNSDLPDADMFIKAQDYDDDWNQINIISSDFDAACTHIYVAFGKTRDHVVADCMVQEAGEWKIRSVTLIK